MKLSPGDGICATVQVALLVSAWIETVKVTPKNVGATVALLVSAWIETTKECRRNGLSEVALLVSAWIETWKLPGGN